MTWFDILKRLGAEPMMERKPDRELQAPNSKVIDFELAGEMDVTDSCCEAARNHVIELMGNIQRRYEEEGREEKAKGIEIAIPSLEEGDCAELLKVVKRMHDISHEIKPPKGHHISPEYLEWRKIYEEWKECDKDVV